MAAHAEGAPDLAVEVLSSGTKKFDRETKLQVYARFGVRELCYADTETELASLPRPIRAPPRRRSLRAPRLRKTSSPMPSGISRSIPPPRSPLSGLPRPSRSAAPAGILRHRGSPRSGNSDFRETVHSPMFNLAVLDRSRGDWRKAEDWRAFARRIVLERTRPFPDSRRAPPIRTR
jgi:hypothetical protein